MSRLDELPPDQRAALSLLLAQGKTYAEVATLLAIDRRAVRDRAQTALALLAPRQARELEAGTREEVGDYLLGQQSSIADRLATRARLAESEPARGWAAAIRDELAPLGATALPEIPDGVPAAAARGETRAVPATGPSPVPAQEPAGRQALGSEDGERSSAPSRSRQLPASRLGGALLLAAIAAAIVIAVVLITDGGGSHAGKAATAGSSAKSATGPAVTQRLTLTSPSGGKTVGVMDILAEGSRRAFFIDAENLPESKGFFYALWLYNSPTSQRPLSASPPVGKDHRLQGGSLLPSDAGSYHTVLVTRETTKTPSHPGPVVLSGAFSLGA
jgi:hypothetical protein